MVNVNRSASRIKSVYMTLDKIVTTDKDTVGRKPWNDLYSPMHPYSGGANDSYSANGEFEAWIQLGSKLYPEYPIRGHSEAFYQLQKCVGIHSSRYNSIDINKHHYHYYKFIMGFDSEKVLEASGTCVNTRNGNLLTINFRRVSSDQTYWATFLHSILVTDNVLKISDVGAI